MATQSITLHQFHISPYCEKVRRALDYKKLPYRICNVPLESRRELRRKTGQTAVPVLEIDGTFVLDSTRICRWLDDRCQGPPLIPTNKRDRALNALLEDWADEALSKTIQPIKWLSEGNSNRIMRTSASQYERTARQWVIHKVGSQVAKRDYRSNHRHMKLDAARRLLDEQLAALDELLATSTFVFGDKPHSCDFAAYGLLKTFEGLNGFEQVSHRERIVAMMRAIDAIPSMVL